MISIQVPTAYDFSARFWESSKFQQNKCYTTITISHVTKWVEVTSKAESHALCFFSSADSLFCLLFHQEVSVFSHGIRLVMKHSTYVIYYADNFSVTCIVLKFIFLLLLVEHWIVNLLRFELFYVPWFQSYFIYSILLHILDFWFAITFVLCSVSWFLSNFNIMNSLIVGQGNMV